MERGPEDRREGSQRSDESTRRGNAVGIGEGAFVGALAGGTLGVALVGNVYLGIGIGTAIGALLGGVIGTRAGGRNER